MKPILITGATGFIGQNLCHMMAQHGLPFRAAVRRTLPSISSSTQVGEINCAKKQLTADPEVRHKMAQRDHQVALSYSDRGTITEQFAEYLEQHFMKDEFI